MSISLIRKEWGAVSYVVAVLLGVLVVPFALWLGYKPPAPVNVPATPSPAASATPSPGSSPSHSP